MGTEDVASRGPDDEECLQHPDVEGRGGGGGGLVQQRDAEGDEGRGARPVQQLRRHEHVPGHGGVTRHTRRGDTGWHLYTCSPPPPAAAVSATPPAPAPSAPHSKAPEVVLAVPGSSGW